MVFSWRAPVLSALSMGVLHAFGFDIARSDNLAVYYGQNSYGATHASDTANWQKDLSYYCQDDTIDTIPLAFVNVFNGAGGLPSLNMANTCNPSSGTNFPGTELPNCQFLASQIKACQAKGKLITLSFGGATGAASFSSASDATAFGDTVWNLFFGGSSSTRPFGTAVLDGVDIDVEGGSTTYYDSFITRIRTLSNGSGKKLYVTGAPQCPFPDAYMSTVLNAVEFDAVYVQFYNNFCGVINYNNPNAWDFGSWDTWAKTVAPNKNVKIYIGALASSTAGNSGYIDSTTLINIALETRSKYSSFGGVMLWDASQAYANGRFDLAVKNAIRQSGGGGSPTTRHTSTTAHKTTTTSKSTSTTKSATKMTTVKTSSTAKTTSTRKTTSTHKITSTHKTTSTSRTTTKTSTSAKSTSTGSSGSCQGVAAWVNSVAYVSGQKVTYNGHLWTAKWWSYGSVPGGIGGDWADSGKC
ncbi:glycoside hydrolase [Ganoderma leucocontextum]|nr:glycoside hydrolase [Ganoderma leucocontextum]